MRSAGGYSGEINTIRTAEAVRAGGCRQQAALPTTVPQTRRNLRGEDPQRGRIALAVVTRDRPDAFARFALAGLREAAAAGHEVVVVDQSAGAETERLVRKVSGARHVRSGPGLARGRNVAVRETTAPIVAFTDDDVAVDPEWLEQIARAFDKADRVGAVCGRAVTPDGALLPGSKSGVYEWPASPFELGSGFNFAFRREALADAGLFDEELGAGARFEAGEDTDMLYRVLRARWRVVCSDEITVVHHDLRPRDELLRLHYGYGLGAGAQTGKHLAGGDRTALAIAGRHAGRHVLTLARAAATLRPRLAGLQVAYLSGMAAGLVRASGRGRGKPPGSLPEGPDATARGRAPRA